MAAVAGEDLPPSIVVAAAAVVAAVVAAAVVAAAVVVAVAVVVAAVVVAVAVVVAAVVVVVAAAVVDVAVVGAPAVVAAVAAVEASRQPYAQEEDLAVELHGEAHGVPTGEEELVGEADAPQPLEDQEFVPMEVAEEASLHLFPQWHKVEVIQLLQLVQDPPQDFLPPAVAASPQPRPRGCSGVVALSRDSIARPAVHGGE